jgi:hypothetical protein
MSNESYLDLGFGNLARTSRKVWPVGAHTLIDTCDREGTFGPEGTFCPIGTFLFIGTYDLKGTFLSVKAEEQ